MKLKNKYFLLRHGENNWRIEHKGLIYPAGNPSFVRLIKKGAEQTKKSAMLLKKNNIDLIYSSDFFRTRQTAQIVAKELRIKKINFDRRLRDINLGIYHGKTKKEFYEFIGYENRKFSAKPPKGESWDEVKKRVVSFIRDVDKKYKNKNILIVGHGDPLFLLEGAVKGWSHKELLKQIFADKNYIQIGELRKLN